jgi:hypothetical protein
MIAGSCRPNIECRDRVKPPYPQIEDQMYESPAYWELKKEISHWKTVREYIDLARTFRSMAYGESLTLSSENGPYTADSKHSVTLRDSLRADCLNFLAQRCEDLAVKIAEAEPKPFDIREACKV